MSTLEQKVASLELSVEELAESLLGRRRSIIAGGGRYSDGLVHRVEQLFEITEAIVGEVERLLSKRRMSTPIMVAIISSSSAIIATLIAELIG